MHKSRNLTSHAYDSKMALEIAEKIRNEYFDLLKKLVEILKKEAKKNNIGKI